MLSFTVDALQLRGTNAPYFVLQRVDGLEAPDYRTSQYDNPGQSGGTVGSEFYGTRTITIGGEIIAPDATTYTQLRQSLAYACRIRKDSNGFPLPVTISFTTLDGVSYTCAGYVKTFKNPLGLPTTSNFLIGLVVTDPMLYGTVLLTTGQFALPTGGGVVYPVVYPATYGGSTGGSAQVNNRGNADSYPVVVLRGMLTRPYIYAVERGAGFKLNYTTAATDVVAIDMARRTVLINGSATILQFKDVSSTWLSLPPGPSTLRLSTSSTSDTGTAEVTAYSAYLGV